MGHEELVVVGGYFTSVLAEMKPYTLDLETLEWRCWEGRNLDVPDSPELPEPRQRMAAMRISKDWLLISGGSPASVGQSFSVGALHMNMFASHDDCACLRVKCKTVHRHEKWMHHRF